MRIKKLRVENFKGLKAFTLEPDGKNVAIYGDNGTGKTTLADAWSWLLTGKNLAGRADFEAKPLGADGDPVHNLETTVEAVVERDGGKAVLKKALKEKWVKKRGEAERVFSGNTIDHQIDGVPVKKKEWDEAMESAGATQSFNLMALHWEKRRSALLEMVAAPADEDVIGDDEELRELPALLDGRLMGDALKIAKARRSETNRAITGIPPRIDELQKTIDAAPSRTPKQIENEIASIEKEIEAKKAGADIGEKRKRLADLRADLAEAGGKARADAINAQAKADNERAKIIADARSSRLKAEDAEEDAGRLGQRIAKLDADVENIRSKWRAIAAEQYQGGEKCPTCGQSLPNDQRAEAEAEWNRQKAARLEETSKAGKEQAAEIERLKAEADKLLKAAAGHRKDAEKLEAEAGEIKAPEAPDKTDAEKALEEQIAALEAEIAAAPSADTSALEASLRDAHDRMGAVKEKEKAEGRVKELLAEEKRLSGELLNAERLLYLAERFELERAKALEETVNALFSTVSWRLFDVQINGGIAPTCKATVAGVPYGYGLNRGAEIAAEIEVADVMMKHSGKSLPIWIDNAEAVTTLPAVDAQTIALYVRDNSDEIKRIESMINSLVDELDEAKAIDDPEGKKAAENGIKRLEEEARYLREHKREMEVKTHD